MSKKKCTELIKNNWQIIIIMLIAMFARLYRLNVFPEGMTPDEAYGAYNAYALMTEGIDSRGYNFPVFFVSWGSGMNALYSYLAIPFIYLFGTATGVYRIPQALVGIITVYFMYKLGTEIYNKKLGLFLAFVLAINPWHVMNTRYALCVNIAPNLMLIGVYYLVIGLKKNHKYLILSALLFGLTLYGYVLSWLALPLFLVLGLLCFWKDIPKNKYLVLFTLILFVMAFPLLLFVAINLDWMPEINTAFMSIPKFPGFRSEELGGSHILKNTKDVIKVVLTQYDGLPHIVSELVGAFYYITSPFMVFGVVLHIVEIVKAVISKRALENKWLGCMLLWLVSAGACCTIVESVTMIHIMFINIPVIFYGAYGMYRMAEISKSKMFLKAAIGFLAASFVVFYVDYSKMEPAYFFGEDSVEVIEMAKEKAGEDELITIVNFTILKYSNLMWIEKFNAKDFSENVVYDGDPAWAEMVAYGRYRYIPGVDMVGEDGLYIISTKDAAKMKEKGFAVETANATYAIAWK